MIEFQRKIESTIEFPRSRVEISLFNWRNEWNGVQRARPDMYVLELNLSHDAKAPSPSLVGNAVAGSFQMGDVHITPPHRNVQRNMANGWRRSLLCLFDRKWMDSLVPSMASVASSVVETASATRTEWLLRNIHQELRHASPGSEIVIESFSNALAVELARRLALRTADNHVRKGGLAPWRMRLLRERIHSNFSAPDLTELAKLCGMTVRHLSRAFKTETGMTPGQYIDAIRAQHARALLSQTTLSLAEIARRLGFATSASFSLAFQRATGLKPRQIERPSR